MNPHKAILDAALRELASWKSSRPANDPTTEQTYDVIYNYLCDAALIEDEDALYDHLPSTNRFGCDAGPLSKHFIPSFKHLFLGLHKSRGLN